MRPGAGTAIGDYEISAQIGGGGMGEVYRARDTRLQRDVALKLIHPDLAEQPDAVDRFLREAVLLSSLNHPNIVTIYETGVVGTDRYIAMEMVQGQTIRELAREPVPIERVCAIVHQVAQALAVAHAAGIVHRDIKPENVMVRSDGYVKILDFGLARFHSEAPGSRTGSLLPTATTPGTIMGTVGYLSPEQIRGETLTAASDVFALGILLYELLAGRHPFNAPSRVGMLHAILWELPEPPSALNQDVPPALDLLVLEALQQDHRLRPTTEDIARRLLAPERARSHIEGARSTETKPSLPIVGREREIATLLNEFDQVRDGTGRVVAISGEAGIGKTTLVEAFLAALLARGDPVRIGRGRCSERLAGSEAYLPVLEVLDSLQHHPGLGSLSRLMRAMAPSWYVQIAPASREGSSGVRLAAETATGSQERLKREIGALLEEAARRHPVILSFDDVHWADPSTTDLLAYLSRRLEGARVLVVFTARPSELAQSRHPFLPLKLDLIARGVCREVWPGSLDREAVGRYLALQFPGHGFPPDLAEVIHQSTEGHPLFMADTLRDLRRRGVMAQQDGRWMLTASPMELQRGLPESVRSLVQRKMDALDAHDRQLLGAASVQGVDFDTAVLSAALALADEQVEERLERLEREHALVRFVDEWEYPDRTLTLRYRFAHHVYHAAFHESLRITRRVALSQAIANAVAERVGDRAREKAPDLALLFESARQGVRAAEFFNLAALTAARVHAHDETRRLAERGLAALERESPVTAASAAAAAAELDLRMTLGLAIKTSRGYAEPEVGRAYARARELCHRVADPGRVVPTLIGLAAHYIVAGEIESSRDIGVEMLALFERLRNPHLQMVGEWCLGAALFHLGDLEDAYRHVRRGLELYDPSFHRPRVWETGLEPGIFCRCEVARLECLRGAPDRALATVGEAVAQARTLGHPQVLAFSLLFAGFIHHERREWKAMQSVLEELLSLCTAKGIAQEVLWAEPFAGVALFELGDRAAGLSRTEAGLDAITQAHSPLLKPFYLVAYAGMLVQAQSFDAADAMLEEAKTLGSCTGQHAYDPELHRVRGELAAARGDAAGAEREFREAMTLAGKQGASWHRLRAATSLAHLLAASGRASEARDLLLPAAAAISADEHCSQIIDARAISGLISLETAT